MDYLRSLDLTDESKKKGNHCIVGQDGDLIMLSLMTKLRNICLLVCIYFSYDCIQ